MTAHPTAFGPQMMPGGRHSRHMARNTEIKARLEGAYFDLLAQQNAEQGHRADGAARRSS